MKKIFIFLICILLCGCNKNSLQQSTNSISNPEQNQHNYLRDQMGVEWLKGIDEEQVSQIIFTRIPVGMNPDIYKNTMYITKNRETIKSYNNLI